MILLGCVTTSIKTAIELAAVLSRSSVQVNIRTALTSINELQPTVAPFEILVVDPVGKPVENPIKPPPETKTTTGGSTGRPVGNLKPKASQSEEERQYISLQTDNNIGSRSAESIDFTSLAHKRIDINSAMSWLISNRTYRYWYVLEETSKDKPESIAASINTMLDKLKDTSITTACHYQWRNNQHKKVDTTDCYRDLLAQCTRLQFSTGENSLIQLDSTIDKLKIADIRHLCVVRSTEDTIESYNTDDWTTAIRGTERFGFIVGPIETGEHLPALLRVRGWLNSSHQQANAETTNQYPILTTNGKSTMIVNNTGGLQLKDPVSVLNDISSNPAILVTALQNGSISVALLQNNTIDPCLLTINAAKLSDDHPLRQVFTVE